MHPEDAQTIVRVFRYRWVILLLYCLYSVISFIQIMQFSIISNITKKYYNVNNFLGDLNISVFMECSIILCLPFNYFIKKYNLKIIAIVTCALTALGNLIKLLSVSRNSYYIVIIGQLLCAIAQVFITNIPSQLASTWFGPEELSTACAIAIIGSQVGIAVGCIWSTNAVRNSDDFDIIGRDFMLLHIINASITCLVLILVVIFFRATPRLPPSQSQVQTPENKPVSLKESLKAMVKNKSFLLLLFVLGSSTGIIMAVGVIANDIFMNYFPEFESELGFVSAATTLAGCIGILTFGFVLDKWHKFKVTLFLSNFASAISFAFVVLCYELHQKLAAYFAMAIFGFCSSGLVVIGLEYGTEMMYPIPASTVCSILNSCICHFILIYLFVLQKLSDAVGYMYAYAVVEVCLILSSALVYFISDRLYRRETNVLNR